MENLINKITLGDCLEVMKLIPDKSIDCIICDIPYGTTACSWDIVIPFDKMWEQLNRIIKNNGAIALFGSEPFSSKLRMSNLKMYKYDWIWIKNKPTGYLEAKNKPMKKHESISIFSKGSSSNGCKNRLIYNPQNLIEINKKYKNSTHTEIYGQRESRKKGTISVQRFTNYPNSILQFNLDNIKLHPTQKPVALYEYLIKTYTKENELVLDFCSGSGTNALACINTNRNFICIEKDEDYYKKSYERLENFKKQMAFNF